MHTISHLRLNLPSHTLYKPSHPVCHMILRTQYTIPRTIQHIPSYHPVPCTTTNHPIKPLGCQLSEQRHRIDHGSSLIRRRRQTLTELMPESDHMMGKIEAVVLEHSSDARYALQSIRVLDRNNLPRNKVETALTQSNVRESRSKFYPEAHVVLSNVRGNQKHFPIKAGPWCLTG